MLKILSCIPCMEGLRIRTLSQELKDKPSLRKLIEMLGEDIEFAVYCIKFLSFISSYFPFFLPSSSFLPFLCIFVCLWEHVLPLGTGKEANQRFIELKRALHSRPGFHFLFIGYFFLPQKQTSDFGFIAPSTELSRWLFLVY